MQRISPLKTSKIKPTQVAGFTLIEIMIVLSIVAGATALLLTRIDNTNNRLKAAVRKIGTLSRDIRYRAKLHNVTYRLVIDMHSGSESEKPHEYWVERGAKYLLSSYNHSPYEEDKDLDEELDEKQAPPPDFEMDTSLTPKKKTLPRGLIFAGVEVASLTEKITSGTIYIHYLPEGLVDESAIHIKYSEDIQWTLSIHPLTGKVDILNQPMSLKEILER